MFKHRSSLAACLLVGGCASLAPTYERPAAPVPTTWPNEEARVSAQPAEKTAADIPWRDFVKNDKLRQVVAQALANSRSLRKSVADVAAARGQYRSQRASLVPHLDASANISKARSLNVYAGSGNSTITTESDSVGVSMSSFEIDLFGKQHSLSDTAFETYLATEAGARSTRISLIAETINAYLTLAYDQSQLLISQRTLQSAKRSMELTRDRFDAGVASVVDVKQAETVYQQARADVASYISSIKQDHNALDLLVGAHVEGSLLPAELPSANDWFAEVPAGLSSQVLLERPDILEAEHNLKSANANIGAARAAFFPSLTLTASGGRGSSSLFNLLSGANVWSFAPNLTVPIFSGGANAAGLASAEAERDSRLAQYELAIQTAFKEVADALAVRETIQEQVDAQSDLVAAAADSYELADTRYSEGADTFLSALDSQRTLYSAQQSLISTRRKALENTVMLYRALGGGMAAEPRS